MAEAEEAEEAEGAFGAARSTLRRTSAGNAAGNAALEAQAHEGEEEKAARRAMDGYALVDEDLLRLQRAVLPPEEAGQEEESAEEGEGEDGEEGGEGDAGEEYQEKWLLFFEGGEARAKRRRMRQAPQIRAQVQRLWEVALSSSSSSIAAIFRLSREEYANYHLSVCRFLLEQAVDASHLEAFDSAAAWEAAQEDWTNDACGQPTLHFDAFLLSVFELADLWTPTIQVS